MQRIYEGAFSGSFMSTGRVSRFMSPSSTPLQIFIDGKEVFTGTLPFPTAFADGAPLRVRLACFEGAVCFSCE